jgi:hypothetical protein
MNKGNETRSQASNTATLEDQSGLTKALAIEKQFFPPVDKANNDDFRPGGTNACDPCEDAQRYDRLCGVSPSTEFATAIDVRLFYIPFTVLKEGNQKNDVT